MGQGIFYCGRCQRQLRSNDLDKGEAVRIDAQILCRACAPADARTDPLPPPIPLPSAPPPSTRRIGTHRIPRVSDTPRSMRAASGRPSAPWLPFAAAGGIAVLILLFAAAASTGRRPGPPAEPPTTKAPPPTPLIRPSEKPAVTPDPPPRPIVAPPSPPAPVRPDPARELAELDGQVRPLLEKGNFANALLYLEAARGRHPDGGWTSEIDRRIADVTKAKAEAAPPPPPPPPSPPPPAVAARPQAPAVVGSRAGPVAWWRLNDRTGTTAADAAGALPGELRGGAEWNADPPAVKLNGRGSGVTIGQNLDLVRKASSATVTAWILPAGSSTGELKPGRILTIDRGKAPLRPRLALEVVEKNQLRFAGRASDDENAESRVVGASAPLAPDRWQHVAATVDYARRVVRLYLDGRELQTDGDLKFTASETSDTPASQVAVGAWGSLEGGFFRGLLADVRLYPRVLEPAEIAALAAAPPSASPAPAAPVGWWRLDDRSGTKAVDAIGDVSGQLDGSAAWSSAPAALRLDGQKGGVSLGEDLELLRRVKAATLTAWIRPEGGNYAGGRIATFNTGRTGTTKVLSRLALEIDDQKQLRYVGKALDGEALTDLSAPSARVAPDRWQHAAVVVDYAARGVRIFLDGRELQTQGKILFTASETSDTPMTRGYIGSWGSDGRVFRGLLSDVRLYDRALAAEEVAALAAARPGELAPAVPAPPSTAGPVGWWKLEDRVGKKAVDAAGAMPGTLDGEAAWSDWPPALKLEGQKGAVLLGENLDVLRKVSAATVTAWIRPESNTALLAPGRIATFAVAEEGRRPVSRMSFEIADGNHLRFVGRASDGEEETRVTASASRVVRDRWQHAAVVVDYAGKSVRIYLDGRAQAVSGAVGFTSAQTSDTPVGRALLGASETADSRVFRGMLADVRLYTRGLDAPEIAALAAKAPGDPDAQRPERVKDGLIALYTFTEGSGERVRDVSGFGEPLDLTIADAGSVRWLKGRGLEISRSTAVASAQPAEKISRACMQSHELTLEAWVRPAQLEAKGPARIVTMSANTKHRNFVLGQGNNTTDPEAAVWSVRCRTSKTDGNGMPGRSSPDGSVTGQLAHLAYTRAADGQEQLYIDGVAVVSDSRRGEFRNWDDQYPLTLANDTTKDRAWLGEYRLVAIYSRALTSAEVVRNFNARAD